MWREVGLMPTIEVVRIDGEKLQRLRLEQFLSRDELAERSGIHRDHIGRLERGYEGESRPPTVRKLAEALGVPPPELVDD
jgi:transcriptional regulator with XRE-family HTH domain